MLKEGNDEFEVTRIEPKVDVCERHYVFNAEQPANATKPLNFSPVGKCPVFEVPQEIASATLDKQRNDEYQIAQLTARNVPVAPIKTGLDGGMNPVFVAKMAKPTSTYDSDGHMRPAPAPTAVASAQTAEPETTAAVPEPKPTKVASAEPATQKSSFFGSLFSSSSNGDSALDRISRAMRLRGPEPTTPAPAAAAAPTPKPKHIAPTQTASAAAIRPKSKSEPREADASKASAFAKPQQEANADAKPASSGVLNGAQAVVPSGSFDSRWGGMR